MTCAEPWIEASCSSSINPSSHCRRGTVWARRRWCAGGSATTTVWPASKFVPQIENTPLSGRLTYWVIDTVAQELEQWIVEHADVFISINVPPEILGRGGLEYARCPLRPTRTSVKSCWRSPSAACRISSGLKALNMMAEQGARIALDDVFLTGANLAVLSRGRFEVIKIDRKIVSQLVEHGPEPTWLPGLQSLLTHSQLKVIAEGVESRYQADVLSQAGVQMAQGYLFSASLTARALMQYQAQDQAL